MARDTIFIDKSLIPYEFNIVLGDEEYTLRVDYNNIGGFFTVELRKNDETLCAGEPIVYGRPLFADIRNKNFPSLDIVPYDSSGKYDKVTWDNLCEGVLLVLDNEEISIL